MISSIKLCKILKVSLKSLMKRNENKNTNVDEDVDECKDVK
jgi:hypothetical protein